MRLHFIAIGGSIMHNLAIALQEQGHQVTGSDDEIAEPSLSRLKQHQLLPEKIGWYPDKIHPGLDAVVLGMHARKDNPELLKAQALNVPVYSFPQYIYEHARNKQRIVIAGSHGKTTVTSMILHVLNQCHKLPDYLVGAQPTEGLGTVKLTKDNPVMLVEGDEYPSSPLDPTPKFLHYQHHQAVVTGIAWDHINVFPTYAQYKEQFQKLLEASGKAGTVFYCDGDAELVKMVEKCNVSDEVSFIPYGLHKHVVKNGQTFLIDDQNNKIPVQFFGEHNMYNVSAALWISMRQGITRKEFYEAIGSFTGAARRLERMGEKNGTVVFRDFAHAPSKLKATIAAVKQQFPAKKLVACMELHTFSSLNQSFLPHYAGSMQPADLPIVYFSPQTVAHKKLEPLDEVAVKKAFGHPGLLVFTDPEKLTSFLKEQSWADSVLLMMSSGTFSQMDLGELTTEVLAKA